MLTIEQLPGSTSRHIISRSAGRTIGMAKVCKGFLDEVWVAPEHRGTGIGAQLTQAAVENGAVKAHVVSDVMAKILKKMGWNHRGSFYFKNEEVAS